MQSALRDDLGSTFRRERQSELEISGDEWSVAAVASGGTHTSSPRALCC
jgi:hypothetical protein